MARLQRRLGCDAFFAADANQYQNVGQLTEVARFKIPETLSFQCGPVLVGDTMFITTVTGKSRYKPVEILRVSTNHTRRQ